MGRSLCEGVWEESERILLLVPQVWMARGAFEDELVVEVLRAQSGEAGMVRRKLQYGEGTHRTCLVEGNQFELALNTQNECQSSLP